VTRCKKLQAVDQTTGGRRPVTKKILDQSLRKILIAYPGRNKATQPLPLHTSGKNLTKIMYPADYRFPVGVKFLGQHIDAVFSGVLLPQGRDDQDYRVPVNLSSQKQAGWRQYPASTFFIAAAKAQADTVFFRYIVRTAARLSGIEGTMKRRMTKGTTGLPSCKSKILINLVKYAKKTDVLKKF